MTPGKTPTMRNQKANLQRRDFSAAALAAAGTIVLSLLAPQAAAQAAIYPVAIDIVEKARQGWTATGGALISLPPEEQAQMMKIFSSVGADVSKAKPLLNDAYTIVTEAAARTR